MTLIVELVPLEDILSLRREVLHPTLPLEALRQPYDSHAGTFHLAAIDEGVVVGCLSLTHEPFLGSPSRPVPRLQLQLHKLAVKASRQGQGLGKLLMQNLVEILSTDTEVIPNGSQALLHFDARLNATSFYERIGMEVLDPEIFTKGVEKFEHVRMGRLINAS